MAQRGRSDEREAIGKRLMETEGADGLPILAYEGIVAVGVAVGDAGTQVIALGAGTEQTAVGVLGATGTDHDAARNEDARLVVAVEALLGGGIERIGEQVAAEEADGTRMGIVGVDGIVVGAVADGVASADGDGAGRIDAVIETVEEEVAAVNVDGPGGMEGIGAIASRLGIELRAIVDVNFALSIEAMAGRRERALVGLGVERRGKAGDADVECGVGGVG